MNETTIPIPIRHITEKYQYSIFEFSQDQLWCIVAGAMITVISLAIGSLLPINIGYLVFIIVVVLYKQYAWTHDMLTETIIMLQYRYYKFRGLMSISYTDIYEKIKTLFPYEIKNIVDGIIYFGNGKYGAIISLSPRKMSPEEIVEFTPIIQRLIDSLPSELIFHVRAKTTITSGNILEKMVFAQLQTVTTKEEKALLFSLYDKSKTHEDNQKWEHTLFIGIESSDEEIQTYLQTIMPGITDMLKSSKVLCTHLQDPIKILSHYSSDFTFSKENNESQTTMLIPKMSEFTNTLSQLIDGGADFGKESICFDGEFYGATILVGIPKDMIGGWPDNIDGQVLPKIYNLSDSREHTIEINVTVDSIDSGDSIEEIKKVLAIIAVNKLSNKNNSNLRILTHSENKYGTIMNQLQDGKINMNNVTYIITVRAKTTEKLAAGISKVRAILKAYSIKTQKAKGNVKDIFKATRFFPIISLPFSTLMPTEALSKVLPIINGSDSIASTTMGKYCLYMGDDIKTGLEYIFDLSTMGAFHAIILGATRGGKTTFLVTSGLRAVSAGIRVFYITVKKDETTNYINAARYMDKKGEVIYLGRGKKNINPLQILFDPSLVFDAKQTFFQHVTILKQFISQLCSANSTDGLNHLQLAYVERTIMRVYAKFGISPLDPITWKQEKQPTLLDLYNIWNADKDKDTKESVQAAVLESRTTSLTHNLDFLSEKTNISFDKDSIVIDLSSLPAELIPAMNYFVTAIIGLRFRADSTRKNIIMVDEGRAFIKTGLGEEIIKIVTQGGSQGVAIWFASQQPADIASISAEFLNNAFIRVIMGNNTEIPEVAAALRLPKSDQNFLSSCNQPGQFLLQMKSPFNQSYHCELNLSTLEKEIIFGEKIDSADDGFKFLVPQLSVFAKERGFVLADWVMKTNTTATLTKDMAKEFIVRTIGLGKVWAYIPKGLIKDSGLIENQTPDHYYSVAGIAGWLIERGIPCVVNDWKGADIVATFPNGKTLAIEYQTSIPGNNRIDKIMEMWQEGEKVHDNLLFVSDSVGVKEIKSIIKTDIVVPRGTQLEERLNNLISENKV